MSEATTVRLGPALMKKIDRVRTYWSDGRGGPDITRSQSVRYLAEIGAKFEEFRLLDSDYPYSAEEALQLFSMIIRKSPRVPTHVELQTGNVDNCTPAITDSDMGVD